MGQAVVERYEENEWMWKGNFIVYNKIKKNGEKVNEICNIFQIIIDTKLTPLWILLL